MNQAFPEINSKKKPPPVEDKPMGVLRTDLNIYYIAIITELGCCFNYHQHKRQSPVFISSLSFSLLTLDLLSF